MRCNGESASSEDRREPSGWSRLVELPLKNEFLSAGVWWWQGQQYPLSSLQESSAFNVFVVTCCSHLWSTTLFKKQSCVHCQNFTTGTGWRLTIPLVVEAASETGIDTCNNQLETSLDLNSRWVNILNADTQYQRMEFKGENKPVLSCWYRGTAYLCFSYLATLPNETTFENNFTVLFHWNSQIISRQQLLVLWRSDTEKYIWNKYCL